jgi:hypothetical protein
MPWFPDFVNAAELARKPTRAAGQAGLAVFERSPDGLLAAARIYDDVAAPPGSAPAPPGPPPAR